MGLLEKLAFGRRKTRPVGDRLETGITESKASKRRRIAIKIGLFLFLIVITWLAYPGAEFNVDAQEGEIWNSATLIAPYTFSIMKDQDKISAERGEVRYEVPPIFRQIDGTAETEVHRNTVEEQFDQILSAYEDYVLNRRRGLEEQAAEDSVTYMSLRTSARVKLSPAQWGLIVNDYSNRIPGMVATSRDELRGERLDQRILDDAYEQAVRITNFGSVDVPLDSIYTENIVIRSESEKAEFQRAKSEVFGLNEAYDMARVEFESLYPANPEYVNLASAFFRAIYQPTYLYLPEPTQKRLREKREMIPVNEGAVERGEIIVQQGDVVTSETLQKIRSLESSQNVRKGNRVGWRIATGRILLTLVTFFFFFTYLYILRRKVFDDNKMLLLITILMSVIIGLFALVVRVEFVSLYVVPVAIASVILTVMFDSRVALFGTITLALIGGQLIYFDYGYSFATIFAGALGIYSVRDIKNRSQFFVSAGLVFIGYALVLVSMYLMQGTTNSLFLSNVLQAGLNSFMIIIAFPLLWVFEKAFDVTTDLTLLELSDTNRPVLKELSIRAPGTFNHTLQVANLAEAAADAVGANALLTRVGALYHDIGKMHKPEYFVENQHPGDNPHDNLKPRMSALIIASHVKEGIDIAQKYNLPRLVEDFIPMHHGTSLIEYFYRKAEEAGDSDEISEAEFRYPGPRPNSKESGILMLADSVEAASRSIQSPTHKRFENLIDSLFASRINDDQLAETNLNFQELDTIKETFLNMLVSMYHVRVKYPGQDEETTEETTEETSEATGDRQIEEPQEDEGLSPDVSVGPGTDDGEVPETPAKSAAINGSRRG